MSPQACPERSRRICVDASIAPKLVLEERDSDKAHALWTSWVAQGFGIIAPCHLPFEATSVLRNHVYRAEITPQAGRVALEAIHGRGIKLIHPDALNERAGELAQQSNRPTACDAYYPALAVIVDCAV